MAFTSPSVANKNNVFHIGPVAPGHHILVNVQECAVFNILQRTSLLIPSFSVSLPHQLQAPFEPSIIECIDVKRVVHSCYKLDENVVRINIPRTPKKIISCNITNIVLKERLYPSKSNGIALGVVIYSYAVEVIYIDSLGKSYSIKKQSKSRCLQAYLDCTSGYLEVNLSLGCYHSNIYSNSRSVVSAAKKNSHFRPVKLCLGKI